MPDLKTCVLSNGTGQNSIRILDLIMNWQENGLLKK